MEGFEAAIKKSIDQKIVANAILVASRKDPEYRYEKAVGKLSIEDDSPNIQLDTVFWVASCTKLLTTISALQCVERGLIALDEPVSGILPEYAHPDILTGMDPATNSPILTPATKPITLRQLLTHTSGMGYPTMSTLLGQWRASLPADKQPPVPGQRNIVKEYLMPLTYEPGTVGKWQYSCALDWAGLVVERLNNGVRLGEYMSKNIFEKLGMKDTTFRPLQRKGFMERVCPRVERKEDGSLKMDEMKLHPHIEPHDDGGGGGLYTTARDYVRVLESLLRDDRVLLGEGMMREMFKAQLVGNEELQGTLKGTGIAGVMDRMSGKGVGWNHGLAGLVAVEGVPGVAGKGTMWWDGLPSCFWWVDRERGTCGFYGSQIFPAGDRPTADLFGEFQKAVYNSAA